jgi:hypothetical protein
LYLPISHVAREKSNAGELSNRCSRCRLRELSQKWNYNDAAI